MVVDDDAYERPGLRASPEHEKILEDQRKADEEKERHAARTRQLAEESLRRKERKAEAMRLESERMRLLADNALHKLQEAKLERERRRREISAAEEKRHQEIVDREAERLAQETAELKLQMASKPRPLPVLPPSGRPMSSSSGVGHKVARPLRLQSPSKGLADSKWSYAVISEGDRNVMANSRAQTLQLEADAKAEGYLNLEDWHSAQCMGFSSALAFYRWQATKPAVEEDDSVKLSMLGQYAKDEDKVPQKDSKSSEDGILERMSRLGLDGADGNKKLILSLLEAKSADSDEIGQLLKLVLDLDESKKKSTLGPSDGEKSVLDLDAKSGSEVLPKAPFKKADFPPLVTASKPGAEGRPGPSIMGKTLATTISRGSVAPAPQAPAVGIPTATWAKQHAEKQAAKQETLVKEASVQVAKATTAKKSAKKASQVRPPRVLRLDGKAKETVVDDLWEAICKDFPDFDGRSRYPFEVQILAENHALFYGGENSGLPAKIRERTMAAASMMPYTEYQGQWLVIGLYTWKGDSKDPKRQTAARQLFRLMWDWAVAVRDNGNMAGTLLDKLDVLYTNSPPARAVIGPKRRSAPKPEAEEPPRVETKEKALAKLSKDQKELLGEMSKAQKGFLAKVKEEVLGLLEQVKCSKQRAVGLDQMISSRMAEMRSHGLTMNNVAGFMAECVVKAYSPDSKEVNEATEWLKAFQG